MSHRHYVIRLFLLKIIVYIRPCENLTMLIFMYALNPPHIKIHDQIIMFFLPVYIFCSGVRPVISFHIDEFLKTYSFCWPNMT